MKKKSLVAMGLAGVMTVGMCVPVLATEIGPGVDGSGDPTIGSASTTVEITEPITYNVTIPATFTTDGGTTTVDLSVDNSFNIEPKAKVVISVVGSSVILKNQNDDKVTWKKSLKVGENDFTSISFDNSDMSTKKITLANDSTDTTPKPAGKYTGQVEFNIAYSDGVTAN